MSIKEEMVRILDEVDHSSLNSQALASYLLSMNFSKVDCSYADLIKGINTCKALTCDDVSITSAGSVKDIKRSLIEVQKLLERLMKCKTGG